MTETKCDDLTTGDVSRLCGVSITTVCGWIDRGLLKAYYIPSGTAFRHRRVRKEDLIEFTVRNGMPVPKDLRVDAGGV